MRVTAEEFRDGYEALSARAAHEPVVITSAGTDALVVISAREWTRLRHGDRRVGSASELTEEWRHAIGSASVPAEFNHLNDDTA